MPEYKKFQYDTGENILPEWITARCLNKEKITLIKAFRIVSGQGLKDSKDAVCSCVAIGDNYQIDQMQAIFAPFIGPFETEQEKAKKEQINITQAEDNHIKAGVNCMLRNWRTLGYTTKFFALNQVLDNMEMKYQK